MRFRAILDPARPTPVKAFLLACSAAAAWAQPAEIAQGGKPGPIKIEADNVNRDGCDMIGWGNVTVTLPSGRVTADRVQFKSAGDGKTCGPTRSAEATGNVTVETEGRVEHGASARIDANGAIVVN